MNILIATNHEYIKYTSVMLYSLFMHNEGSIDIYLPYTSLSMEDINLLSDFVRLFPDKKLIPFKIDDDFDKSVTSHNGISIETYYRILAIDLLPEELDRILYLDADMVIQGSLLELYSMDINDHPFVVCEDILGILNDFHEANKMRMNIPKEYSYFNAGVMLFNLKYLRETEAAKKIIDNVYKNQDRYEYNDQDVLNEMYYDKLIYAPWDKYNLPPAVYMLDKEALKDKVLKFASYAMIREQSKNTEKFTERYIDISEQLKSSAIIIHYMGAAKPWTADKNSSTYNSFNELYFKYELPVKNRLEINGALFAKDKTEIVKKLLADNYTYYYLKNRLKKACTGNIATIVAGSSYGVQGILDIKNSSLVNLSGPSQDIRESVDLCRLVIDKRISANMTLPKICILMIGYYAMYDDLREAPAEISKSYNITYEPLKCENMMAEGVSNLYSYKEEIRQKYTYLTDDMIKECDGLIDDFFSTNNYFNTIYTREDNDRDYIGKWEGLNDEQKGFIVKKRTDKHNHLITHKSIKSENEKILTDFIKYLSESGITLVFLIPPFSRKYQDLIEKKYIEEIFEFLDRQPYEISFIDMNEFDAFGDGDFFDSDHLNDAGAEKLTGLLSNI